MFAARQRASCLARQAQRSTRRYASDAHGHHHQPEVKESFGIGSIATAGTFFASVLVYSMSPKKGESSGITEWITSWTSKPEEWEQINTAHTLATKQAGFDRNLFENTTSERRWHDVAYPEALESHCARNVRAGHINHIDEVVAHYQKEHQKEEDRKAKKLAETN